MSQHSSQSATETILITGAGGFLGALLPAALLQHDPTTHFNFILTDTFPPHTPPLPSTSSHPPRVHTLSSDLTQAGQVQSLFETPLGIPDTIYSMHGIMSLGSETSFEQGMKVNFDSTRELLECAKKVKESSGKLIKVIFTSSVATYGGPLPKRILPSTACTPQGAYGTAKLMCEYLVTEYSRRGLIDGRSVKLPTIVVRPGAPAAATSSFLSSIIRCPIRDERTTCPIGTSLEDPLLSETSIWISSPSLVLQNLHRARQIPSDLFPMHSRSVALPGFKVTLREILDELGRIVDVQRVRRCVEFQGDEVSARMVASWPSDFDVTWAVEELGFKPDSGGIKAVIQDFLQTEKATQAAGSGEAK